MEEFFEDTHNQSQTDSYAQPPVDDQNQAQQQFERNQPVAANSQYSDLFDAFNEEQNGNEPMQSAPQPQIDAGVIYVSPEQQKRKDKLKQIEEERLTFIREREESERKQKIEKRNKAQQYLSQFKSDFENDLKTRKEQNRQQQAIQIENKKNHNDYKNSWEKVVANVTLKDGEYPGTKDVSKMRQAILNKRIDLSSQQQKQS